MTLFYKILLTPNSLWMKRIKGVVYGRNDFETLIVSTEELNGAGVLGNPYPV